MASHKDFFIINNNLMIIAAYKVTPRSLIFSDYAKSWTKIDWTMGINQRNLIKNRNWIKIYLISGIPALDIFLQRLVSILNEYRNFQIYIAQKTIMKHMGKNKLNHDY